MKTEKRTGKVFSALMIVAAVCMYFICDQTLEWAYPFYCMYKIQTLVRFGRLATMAIVIPSVIIVFIRNRRKSLPFDWGMTIPLLAVYVGYFVSCFLNREEAEWLHLIDSFSATAVQVFLFVLVFSDEGILLKKNSESGACDGKKDSRTGMFVHLIAVGYLGLSLCNAVFYFFPQLYCYLEEPNWYVFFLGSKNRVGWPLMVGAFFVFSDVKIKHWRVMRACYFALLVINALITKCVTTYVGVAAVTVYLLLPFVRQLFDRWHFCIFVLIIFALFAVCMCDVEPLLNTPPVKTVLAMVGKKPSLSGRTELWEAGRSLAMEKPLFGHGFYSSPSFVPYWRISQNGTLYYTHAHNEYLQIWYDGGAFTLAAAFGMLFYTGKRLQCARDKKSAGSVKAILFFTLVMLLAELIPYYCWYIVTVMCNAGVMIANEEAAAS